MKIIISLNLFLFLSCTGLHSLDGEWVTQDSVTRLYFDKGYILNYWDESNDKGRQKGYILEKITSQDGDRISTKIVTSYIYTMLKNSRTGGRAVGHGNEYVINRTGDKLTVTNEDGKEVTLSFVKPINSTINKMLREIQDEYFGELSLDRFKIE